MLRLAKLNFRSYWALGRRRRIEEALTMYFWLAAGVAADCCCHRRSLPVATVASGQGMLAGLVPLEYR